MHQKEHSHIHRSLYCIVLRFSCCVCLKDSEARVCSNSSAALVTSTRASCDTSLMSASDFMIRFTRANGRSTSSRDDCSLCKSLRPSLSLGATVISLFSGGVVGVCCSCSLILWFWRFQ